MRPTFITIFCKLVESLKLRSTCERRQVGCVVVSEDFTKVYGIGYNGNYKGGPNCCDRPNESGNCGCLHAEENCLLKVSESNTTKKIVFITLSPCITCAKRLINVGGVKEVYITEEHHRQEGTRLLMSQGIKVYKVGYDFQDDQFKVVK